MPTTTTEWERQVRRRKVIRHRFEHGRTAAEISDELGWSEATIVRNLDWVREQTARMGEPNAIRDQVLASISLLLTHEFDDLHRADLDGDPATKHRAKTSLRQTLRLLTDLHEDIANETPAGDERIADLPERAQEVLSAVAEEEIEKTISVE